MPDYYPLLVRAIARLERSTAQARRTVFERARAALVTQTFDFTPSDVTSHRLALEEAIRKVEAECLRRALADIGSPKSVLRVRPADRPNRGQAYTHSGHAKWPSGPIPNVTDTGP